MRTILTIIVATFAGIFFSSAWGYVAFYDDYLTAGWQLGLAIFLWFVAFTIGVSGDIPSGPRGTKLMFGNHSAKHLF